MQSNHRNCSKLSFHRNKKWTRIHRFWKAVPENLKENRWIYVWQVEWNQKEAEVFGWRRDVCFSWEFFMYLWIYIDSRSESRNRRIDESEVIGMMGSWYFSYKFLNYEKIKTFKIKTQKISHKHIRNRTSKRKSNWNKTQPSKTSILGEQHFQSYSSV